MEASETFDKPVEKPADHPGGAMSTRGQTAPGKAAHEAKTRRQLLEEYVTRQDHYRQRHYDFCSKQVLSVYTTFPRPFFAREDRGTGKDAWPKLPEDKAPTNPEASANPSSAEDTEGIPVTSKAAEPAAEPKAVPGAQSQKNWGCSPRFPLLDAKERRGTGTSQEVQCPAAFEVTPRKVDRLQLLKTSPAWSFGSQGVGHRYPGTGPARGPRDTDFRSLRESLAFDASKLLETPPAPRPSQRAQKAQ